MKRIGISTILLFAVYCALFSDLSYSQRSRRADSVEKFFIGSWGPFDRWPYQQWKNDSASVAIRAVQNVFGPLSCDSCRYINLDDSLDLNAEVRGIWDYPTLVPAERSKVLGGAREPSLDVLFIEPLQLFAAFNDAAYIRFEFERHTKMNDSIEYPGFINHTGLIGSNDATSGTSPNYLIGTSRQTSDKSLRVNTDSDNAGVFNDSLWHRGFIESNYLKPVYYFRGNEQKKLLVRTRVRIDTAISDPQSSLDTVYTSTISEYGYKAGSATDSLLNTHTMVVQVKDFYHVNSNFDTIDFRFLRNPNTMNMSFNFHWNGKINFTGDWMEIMTAHIDSTTDSTATHTNGYPTYALGEAGVHSGEDFLKNNPTQLISLIDSIIVRYSADSSHHINYIRIGDEFGLGQALPFKRLVKLFRERSNGRVEVVPFVMDSNIVGYNPKVCDFCGFGDFSGGKLGFPSIYKYAYEGARLGWVDTSLYADPKMIMFDSYVFQKGIPLPKRTTHSNPDSIIAWEKAHASTDGDSTGNMGNYKPTTTHYSKDFYLQRIQNCAAKTFLNAVRTSNNITLRNEDIKMRYGLLWQSGMSVERVNRDAAFLGTNVLRYSACLRPPTSPELKVTGHLATSCGSKGLLLYLLNNYPDTVDGANGGIMARNGAHSENIHQFRVVHNRDSGLYTTQSMWMGWSERYDTCLKLFPLLKTYGNTLFNAKYVGDWTASELPAMDTSTHSKLPFYFDSVFTHDDSLRKDTFVTAHGYNDPDSANRTFVHISMWIDTVGGASDTMLYITNMRTDDSYDTTEVPTTIDRRLITMKMKRAHIIEDVAFPQGAQLDNEKIWTPYVGTQTGDLLKLFLKAGDGILIRLADTTQGTMRQTRIAINYPKNGEDFNDHGRVVFNRPVPGVLDKTNSAKWSIPSSSRPYIVGIPDTTTAKMWQDSLLYRTVHSTRTGWWRHQNWTEKTNPTPTATFTFVKQLGSSTVRNPHFSTDSIAHKIAIRTDLEEQGIGNTRVRIFDPWFVDSLTLRNFNQVGDTLQQTSPFLPHVLTSGVLPGASMTGYGGIFRAQNDERLDSIPMYTLNAFNTIKPITLIHTDTFATYTDWNFIHWWTNDSASPNDPTPWVSTDDGSVNFEPKNNPIFMKDSSIYIARYKAHMAAFESASDIGFDHNNQRKLYYLFTDTLGRRWYRIVYSSGGKIFAANGFRTGPQNVNIHWNREELISKWDTDEATAEFPSMGYHETAQDTTFHYVWTQNTSWGEPSIMIGRLINGYPRLTYTPVGNSDQGNTPLPNAMPSIGSVDGSMGRVDVVAFETENGICLRAIGNLFGTDDGVRTGATARILGNSTSRHPTVWVDTCHTCGGGLNEYKLYVAWDMDSLSFFGRNFARQDTVRDVWVSEFTVRHQEFAPYIAIDTVAGASTPKNLSIQLRPNSTDNRNPCISGARYTFDTNMVRIAYETDIHPDTDNVVKQGITVAHKRSGFNWNITKFFQTNNTVTNQYWKPSIEVQRYHDSSGTLLVRDNYYSLTYERANGTAIQHWAMDDANQRVVSHIFTNTRHPQLAVDRTKVDSNSYRMCLATDSEPHWLIPGYTGLYKYAGNDTLWGYHAIVESDSNETLTVEYGYGEPTIDDGSGARDLELLERDDTLNVDTDHTPEYFTASERFTLPETGTFTWYPWVHTSNQETYQSDFDTLVYVLDFYDTTGTYVTRLDSLVLCDSVPNILGETRSITITQDSAVDGYVTFRRLTDGLVTSTARWEPIIMTEPLSDNGAYKRVGRIYQTDDKGLFLEAVPNPTTGQTEITFTIPDDGSVTLEALNALGNRADVITQTQCRKGRHVIGWDASRIPPGVYVIQMRFGNYTRSLRVIVIR